MKFQYGVEVSCQNSTIQYYIGIDDSSSHIGRVESYHPPLPGDMVESSPTFHSKMTL